MHRVIPRVTEFIAWALFLVGASHAWLIWTGQFDHVPESALMLSAGLFGTAGLVVLGLVAWCGWALIGFSVPALVRLACHSRSHPDLK